MSVIIQDGFDLYSTVQDVGLKWNLLGNSFDVNGTGGRFSGGSVEFNGQYGNCFAYSFEPETTVRVGFAWRTTDNYDDDYVNLKLRNSEGVDLAQIYLRPDRVSFDIRNRKGDSIQPFLPNWSLGTYHWLEWEVTVGTPGNVKLYSDGVLIVDKDVQVYRENDSFIREFRVYSYRLGNGARLDDIIVWNNDGQGLSTFPIGDSRIHTLHVNGAGSQADFTPTGDTSNELTVDDSPGADRDTTYNSSTTVGDRDLFAIQSLPQTPDEILNVQLNNVMRKEDAGNRGGANVLKSGATIDVSQAGLVTPDYKFKMTNYGQNPATSSQWTETEINNLEIGYEVSS